MVKVLPGQNTLVGGWFAGGGPATVTLRLIDGVDPGGTEFASSVLMQTAGGEQTDWVEGTVQGVPTSEFMTVVWELSGGGGEPAASHADGFYLESNCNVPFADTDADGDVDHEDFAFFQACHTGADGVIPSDPIYCSCLEVEGVPTAPDGDIDPSDLAIFEGCASGPGIPADPGCNSN